MKEYGLFHDQGVRGKDPSRVSPNAKIKGQQGVGRNIVTGRFEKVLTNSAQEKAEALLKILQKQWKSLLVKKT